jgi:hypothetical protein
VQKRLVQKRLVQKRLVQKYYEAIQAITELDRARRDQHSHPRRDRNRDF